MNALIVVGVVVLVATLYIILRCILSGSRSQIEEYYDRREIHIRTTDR